MDGLSATMHQCSKIWLMYPPSGHNLRLLETELGQPLRLARFANRLEGGIAVKTDSTQAVFIPAGCLHACFTTTGGFLVSVDCTTRTSIRPFSRYLQHQLYMELDSQVRHDVFHQFLETLHVAVANGMSSMAVEAWVHAQSVLSVYSSQDVEWRMKAGQVLQKITLLCGPCPCGLSYRSTWHEHWTSQHVAFLSEMPSSASLKRRHRACGRALPL